MVRVLIPASLHIVLLFAAAPAFAQTLLPAYVLQLPESVGDVFIADTSAATIYRFEQSSAGMTLGHEGYMSIGEGGAGKERAWDRRTPLGIYFVVDQLDTSSVIYLVQLIVGTVIADQGGCNG